MSCPHTHQQNGAGERKHRHIVETGLTLLAHASVPFRFWSDAFVTACFLINRIPTRRLHMKSPLEVLLNETPDYSLLKVFGCACWPHLRPYNKHKLEYRSKQCVFLGYSPLHKGYKCLHIPSNRVYISRDVVFDETVFPFSTLTSPTDTPITELHSFQFCLINLWMLHILLCCCLTMVQGLDEALDLSFWMMIWPQLRQLLLRRMRRSTRLPPPLPRLTPTSITRACPMHEDPTG